MSWATIDPLLAEGGADAVFRFVYKSEDDRHDLDAYDASQALYGIARSISILTHYTINGTVIKQAPSLKGARVKILPPNAGSFEFIVPVLQLATDPNVQAVGQGLVSSTLYDLSKLVFRRVAGKRDEPQTETVRRLSKEKSGDLSALTDTINEDVVRIQRPIATDQSGKFNINIIGGRNKIVVLDHDTDAYARTKVLGDHEDEFLGHVRAFNGSTTQGRLWITEEDRTVSFSQHKHTRLSTTERRRLSWSLDQWVNREEGLLLVRGFPLSSKTGLLKHVFITSVSRA